MALVAPIWLFALLPWAAAVLWLLWGRFKRVYVPFLDLWKGPAARPIEKSAFQPPPFWLGCAMLAMLLAVLAAARPALITRNAAGRPVTIIIDRGITMSARGATDLRYRELIGQVFRPVMRVLGPGPTEVLSVPAAASLAADRSDWNACTSLPPTAIDTAPLLRPLVMQLLRETRAAIIVLSDHDLHLDDPRIVQVAPATFPINVGIVLLAARETPTPQILVRLRNQSPTPAATLRTARLVVSCAVAGAVAVEAAATDIALPATGERDYFIDLPSLAPVISVQVQVNDDLAADNQAWLVREQCWPAIEPRASLPAELGRMIDLYSRLRPPATNSRHVAVVNSMDDLPLNEPAAILAPGDALGKPIAAQVALHPVTRAVANWISSSDDSGRPVAARPALDASWTPVVSWQGRTIIAVRERPVRQVWVGIRPESWASSPDFVIFWTNVFSWLGEGAPAFASHPVSRLGPGWTCVDPASSGAEPGLMPGLYRRADGALRAVNAMDVKPPTLQTKDVSAALTRLAADASVERQGRDLSPPALLGALGLALMAAMSFRDLQRR